MRFVSRLEGQGIAAGGGEPSIGAGIWVAPESLPHHESIRVRDSRFHEDEQTATKRDWCVPWATSGSGVLGWAARVLVAIW